MACAKAQWFEVCLVLCYVEDLNPYQLSCLGGSVGRALAYTTVIIHKLKLVPVCHNPYIMKPVIVVEIIHVLAASAGLLLTYH